MGWLARLSRTPERVALFLCARDGGSTRIPLSQFQLFMDERRAITDRFGVTPWFVFDDAIDGLPDSVLSNVSHLCIQTHYDIAADDYRALTQKLLSKSPEAKIIHFDLTAPADLRQAGQTFGHADLFVKKHVLKDHGVYSHETIGMTNLSDHYARSFGIEKERHKIDIPEGFFETLEIGPTFFTEFGMRRAFEFGSPDDWPDDRHIDVHARFGMTGLDWYVAMREQARAALDEASSFKILKEFPVPLSKYIDEMAHSKICFSPFGYGEICWRDFEALSVGALLIKPDVSHIDLRPNVLIPNETYVPIKWDCSDLAEKIAYYVERPDERLEIARNGFEKLQTYFRERSFEAHFEQIFSS